jgi:peroxiredoxin
MGRARFWAIVGAVLVVGLLTAACASGTPKIKNAKLEVGDKAPDFRLPDHTGGYIRLSDYQGQKNVVLAFYPLAWTPV